MLPRLVRVLLRAGFNTRLLKLESSKHNLMFHDSRAWAAPLGIAGARLGAGLGEINVTATGDVRRPANAIWLRASYDLIVRAERMRCLTRDRGTPETVRHESGRQLPNSYPTNTQQLPEQLPADDNFGAGAACPRSARP